MTFLACSWWTHIADAGIGIVGFIALLCFWLTLDARPEPAFAPDRAHIPLDDAASSDS
jgi:hypothetical protein